MRWVYATAKLLLHSTCDGPSVNDAQAAQQDARRWAKHVTGQGVERSSEPPNTDHPRPAPPAGPGPGLLAGR